MASDPVPPSADSEAAWSQWFDVQLALDRKVGECVDNAVRGRSDAFGAALCASLIEHLSEKLRMYLTMPASDVREEGGDG